MGKNFTTEAQRDGDSTEMAAKSHKIRSVSYLAFFSLCLCVSVVNLSCGSKPTDMRSLVPADSLVYLETNDLAAALQPIIDSKPFTAAAKSKPDFSALKGVQLAVAVTGFETSEEKVNDEQSIGRVQPRFVAIADTHAWNFQAVGFAEQKLGSFVEKIYDQSPTLEKSEKNGGKYFTWTANNRKAYALVIDSLIYFGNDESAIDKCLAVRRGETDSIIKTGSVKAASQETLASGYVSTDGVAQIANIVALKFASEAAEDSEIQSAIAGILPQLLRNSITEINWTATKIDEGIEDKYQITTSPLVAQVLSESIVPSESGAPTVEILAPANASSVTRYDIKDLRIAWRSLLLVAEKQTDALVGKIIAEFSNLLFEPYGVAHPELFLESATSIVATVRLDENGEKLVLIAGIDDYAKMKQSMSDEINFSAPPLKMKGEEMWQSTDGTLAFARHMGFVLIGDPVNINSCIYAAESHFENFNLFAKRKAPVITIANESITAAAVADAFSQSSFDNQKSVTRYTTETHFKKTGIERRTVSDFGLIGSIIAQLAQD